MSALEVMRDQPASLPAATPAHLLQIAVSQGADLEKLEKLMELQERWQAGEARKAFNAAMAAFKSDPPRVTKDKDNLQYGSRYTTIGNLVATVNAAMSPHGLSATWDVEQGQQIKVTCILSHVDGHEKRVSMSGPPDDSGKKNSLQQIKSTVTYLKAATFEAVTGVASEDGNLSDDGNGAGPATDTLSEAQQATIADLLEASGRSKEKFLQWAKVESIAAIPADWFQRCKEVLEAKPKAQSNAQ